MVKDLTKGNVRPVLWSFTIPMFISVVFQQLYNIADSAIAGRFAGEDALAAVGASYPITMIFMAIAIGCNVGCAVVISSYFGAGDIRRMKTAISTTLIASTVLAVALTIFGLLTSSYLMQMMNTPHNIFDAGDIYLKIYIGGMVFLFCYNVATGIFTALGDSKTPLYFLIGSSVGNVVLDYLFVAVFHFGVSGVGWATFLAQGIAGVDVFSGAGFRMVMWVVFTALGCGMTMFYAAKVKKTPEISVAYESDQYFRDQNEKTGIDEGHSFGIGHILVLVTLAVTVVWVIWGVMAKGYYMAEIATQFFIMGIVAGVIGVIFHLNDMKVNDIAVSFKDGAKDLIGAALVVAMAQGIMQVLGGSDPTTPTVINTIMYGISQALAGLSGAAAAVLMYVFQSVFNFFVVSGSGQAAITMPIMAPLADLLGVSRQTSVLAFQLGDAFTNLIVPTSGCLIGSLAIAKIEWSNWIKFMWKFLGILMIGAVITILIAVAIGF